MATERDFTALSRATRIWRIASTIPVVCFGVTVATRLSAWRAAISASIASVFPRRLRVWGWGWAGLGWAG